MKARYTQYLFISIKMKYSFIYGLVLIIVKKKKKLKRRKKSKWQKNIYCSLAVSSARECKEKLSIFRQMWKKKYVYVQILHSLTWQTSDRGFVFLPLCNFFLKFILQTRNLTRCFS